MIMWVFLLQILCAALGYAPKEPLVTTNYGQVRGSVRQSRSGREFDSFRGIPYAKPPVGGLRFAAPQPPDKWTFPLDARNEGPFCIQKNYFFDPNPKVEGQEDCLYLNIYVPKTSVKEPLPVMVFIHWGGFFAGRGTSDYLGPEYFMDRDVILVTFNYRLAVLGFLTTLDDFAPGNYALKDQVLALRFVKENIRNFGGDDEQITIFGQSAGAGSVSLHLVSPLSKGLFNRAISQSGVALDLWARPVNALQTNVTLLQAALVGCGNATGSSELISCLRQVDARVLVETDSAFKFFYFLPYTPYTLVTEVKSEANPEPFLTKDPLESLQAGEFQKVPYIVGSVQDEGILAAAPFIRQTATREALNANFDTLLPAILYASLSSPQNPEGLTKNVIDYFLGGKHSINISDPNNIQGFVNIYTDRAFVYGTYQALILQSLNNHNNIWVYNFDYKGNYTYGDLFAATSENIDFNWGVSHCDDLLYLFKSPALLPDLANESDLRMSEYLLNLWTNFATYGHPDPDLSLNWQSLSFGSRDDVTSGNIKFLNITGSAALDNITFNVQTGYRQDRMRFWIGQNLAENFPGLH